VNELTLFFFPFSARCFSWVVNSFSLVFRTVFEIVFVYSVYPFPVETLRGSNFTYSFSHTLFYPLSFCDKKGEYFLFWTGIVFLTSQVIFVPEWPNGEFVSL
jgi:hypothetical protein